MTGWVVHFDRAKSYGKVRGDNGRQYFVHRHDLVEVASLERGQRVELTPTETERGLRATEVRLQDGLRTSSV